MSVSGGGPVVYALVDNVDSSDSNTSTNFLVLHFLSLVLMRKLVCNAQTKPAGRR